MGTHGGALHKKVWWMGDGKYFAVSLIDSPSGAVRHLLLEARRGTVLVSRTKR